MTNFDISKATARAIDTMVSLSSADRHPANRDEHLKAALRSFLALAPIMDRLAKSIEKPAASNIHWLEIDRTREPVSPWAHQSNEGVRS